MKKIVIICLAAAFTGCGIYKPYTRPEVTTAGLYGEAETADSTTLGDIRWQEMFTDPQLQELIDRALENNTDLQSAGWRIKEAEATLKSARLAYLPSFNFAPQGSLSSFDNSPVTKTYSIPVTASWQIDIFNSLTNAKRKSKALYLQSKEYEQAVKTQLIASVANLYYTLLMLDSQYEITEETAAKWRQSVVMMRDMKDAGMTNEAGVAQYEANTLSTIWPTSARRPKTASARCWAKRRTRSAAAGSRRSSCPRPSPWACPCRCSRTVPTSVRPSIRSCSTTTPRARPVRHSIPRSR